MRLLVTPVVIPVRTGIPTTGFSENYRQVKKQVELPQHNRMYRDVDPNKILHRASNAMHINLDKIRKSRRLSP